MIRGRVRVLVAGPLGVSGDGAAGHGDGDGLAGLELVQHAAEAGDGALRARAGWEEGEAVMAAGCRDCEATAAVLRLPRAMKDRSDGACSGVPR